MSKETKKIEETKTSEKAPAKKTAKAPETESEAPPLYQNERCSHQSLFTTLYTNDTSL